MKMNVRDMSYIDLCLWISYFPCSIHEAIQQGGYCKRPGIKYPLPTKGLAEHNKRTATPCILSDKRRSLLFIPGHP